MDDREAIELQLRRCPFLRHTEAGFFHGRVFPERESLQAPSISWGCCDKPRDDHECPEWLTATEFEDAPSAAALKIETLAHLLRMSRKTVCYTGAGISVAANVGQAARGSASKPKGGKFGPAAHAKPTTTHYALAELARMGLVHEWVQVTPSRQPPRPLLFSASTGLATGSVVGVPECAAPLERAFWMNAAKPRRPSAESGLSAGDDQRDPWLVVAPCLASA